MKKLILTLAAVFTFTSALASKNTQTIEPLSVTDHTAQAFVLQKAPLNLVTLNVNNPALAAGPSCSQICFNTFRACLAAGLPGCNARFIRCIDTCEGAGGLYN